MINYVTGRNSSSLLLTTGAFTAATIESPFLVDYPVSAFDLLSETNDTLETQNVLITFNPTRSHWMAYLLGVHSKASTVLLTAGFEPNRY